MYMDRCVDGSMYVMNIINIVRWRSCFLAAFEFILVVFLVFSIFNAAFYVLRLGCS